jgi:hypothetical protein
MARSIAVIKQQLLDQKNATPELDGLTSTSDTAIWNLWLFIQATAINVFENLQDVYKAEVEAIAAAAIPNTDAWVAAKAFEYQYGDTIQLINLVPTYSIINSGKRIITRCSVKTDNNKICQIKVAKGDNPATKLTSPELSGITSYYNTIGNAGISYNIISDEADKIEIVATVYYDGQYGATIQESTEKALNDYLRNIPFDGIVYVSKIEDIFQGITGVKDIKLTTINTRRNSQGYGTGTVLYDLPTGTNARFYQTYAGYILEETEPLHTFADKITYTII